MKTLPRLHLIGPMEGVVSPQDFIKIGTDVGKAVECAIHVRMPNTPGVASFDVARMLKFGLLSTSSQVIVNDRIDVAMSVNAAGVQLGEQSLPVQAARRLVGNTRLIGRSVHDVAGARKALSDGADFLIAGHVFDTDSKEGEPGKGLEWLRQICNAALAPVVAIGGITLERVDDVLEAGAWGVAVSRDILQAEDPVARAVAITERITERTANDARYRREDNNIAKWIER
jgi:thiazole tautomerase (transcriptional regulator TenI)